MTVICPNTTATYRLFEQIKRLAGTGNLTAAIIHLNDTYLIEERRFGDRLAIPGMARIASLVRAVQDAVQHVSSSARTFVVHSGDFLSPSLLSKKLHGQAMVDVLNRLPLEYATLGNHEFDFETEVLVKRLQEAKFPILLANLKPPDKWAHAIKFEELVFWPEHEPLIAFTGLMSEEVAKSAKAQGFTYEPYTQAIFRITQQMQERRACKLIVLSHCSQEEDRKLATWLRHLGRDSFAGSLILGGHDHDIDWSEGDLSKNLSNCRSVSVFLIPTDSLQWGCREQIVNLENQRMSNVELAVRVVRGEDPRGLGVSAVFPGDLPHCLGHLPRSVAEAFTRRLNATAHSLHGSIADDLLKVYDYRLCDDEFYEEEDFTGRYPLYASGGDLDYPPDSDVSSEVAKWLAERPQPRSGWEPAVIRDFSQHAHSLDARDDSLRTGSTDFGNFIADCIKRGAAADLAVVNAGIFRVDMQISPVITLETLEEAFLYDNSKAVMLIEVTSAEFGAILDHSDREPGHGRVLQRTTNARDFKSDGRAVRLALPSFLLCDESDFDGYRQMLAGVRGVESEALRVEMIAARERTGRRLIDLVRLTAADASYCPENRFSTKSLTLQEQDSSEAVGLIRGYRATCKEAGLERRFWIPVLAPSRNTLEKWIPEPLPFAVVESRAALWKWTQVKIAQRGEQYMHDLKERLESHPDWYRSREPFDSYLYAAIMEVLHGEDPTPGTSSE